MISVLTDTVRKEGVMGLYKGVGPTIAGALPYEGIKFGCYDLLVTTWAKDESGNVSITGKFCCGAAAGTVSGFVLYPNDTVRKLMQMQREGDKLYDGALDCYRKVYRNHGIARFYRGVLPYLSRMVPNAAIQFGIYESFKQFYLAR
mmetsp:Transcript_5469/g.9154  ORF Transcript_5469/g.9154 Transcript_5469/m.9154 type:complete len:146 (-) Transcript_5469:279-716(-)